MTVAVITPSLPTRTNQLLRAMLSVTGQTHLPDRHLVAVDYQRAGSAAVRNQLVDAADAAGIDWVAPLDDDDWLAPNHLQLLLAASRTADVVYSYCQVTGRDGWNPNRGFDPAALRRGNFIPITTLIRTELWRDLDGWRDSSECEHGWEDWDFWVRALDIDATFVCVPETTWVYNFHPGCKTVLGEALAS